MILNDNQIFTREAAHSNMYKIFKTVDSEGIAVILENNKPEYVVVNFDEYQEIENLRNQLKKNQNQK